jgi:hypothetical protein
MLGDCGNSTSPYQNLDFGFGFGIGKRERERERKGMEADKCQVLQCAQLDPGELLLQFQSAGQQATDPGRSQVLRLGMWLKW